MRLAEAQLEQSRREQREKQERVRALDLARMERQEEAMTKKPTAHQKKILEELTERRTWIARRHGLNDGYRIEGPTSKTWEKRPTRARTINESTLAILKGHGLIRATLRKGDHYVDGSECETARRTIYVLKSSTWIPRHNGVVHERIKAGHRAKSADRARTLESGDASELEDCLMQLGNVPEKLMRNYVTGRCLNGRSPEESCARSLSKHRKSGNEWCKRCRAYWLAGELERALRELHADSKEAAKP